MSVVDHKNLGFRDRRNVNIESCPDNQIVCDILNGSQKMMMMVVVVVARVVVIVVVVIVGVMRIMMVVIYHGNDANLRIQTYVINTHK